MFLNGRCLAGRSYVAFGSLLTALSFCFGVLKEFNANYHPCFWVMEKWFELFLFRPEVGFGGLWVTFINEIEVNKGFGDVNDVHSNHLALEYPPVNKHSNGKSPS